MRKILVVDDEPEIAESIVSLLAFRGYEAEVAWSGVAALRIAESGSVGLVLLDWNLPGSPAGLALVEQLRRVSAGVPIVVVSGDRQALTEALQAHVADYLPKPFLASDLLRVVDEYAVWPESSVA